MSYKKILFITSQGLYDGASQAGHVGAYKRLEIIAQEADVYCICVRSPAEQSRAYEGLKSLCKEVKFIDVSSAQKLWNAIRHFSIPILFAIKYSSELLRIVEQMIEHHQIERVHIEWGNLALLGKELKQRYPQLNISIALMDLISDSSKNLSLFSRGLLKYFWQFDAYRSIGFEKRYYRYFDLICVMGEADALKLKRMGMNSQKMISIAVPFAQYETSSKCWPLQNSELNIIFWGAYVRYQNVDGALVLIDQLLPILKAVYPNIKLIILGSQPPAQLQSKASDEVEVTGFVENPSPYFDRAHVAVMPLRYGAGIKVKVLECLAAGIPVLTSPVGAENIDASEQQGLYVCETNADYGTVLSKLLTDPEQYQRVSQAGIAWADQMKKENDERTKTIIYG